MPRNNIVGATLVDTSKWSRLREVDEYAQTRGISRREAVERLVNHALSVGPNPYHDVLRSYAELHNVSEEQAYAALWGYTPTDLSEDG